MDIQFSSLGRPATTRERNSDGISAPAPHMITGCFDSRTDDLSFTIIFMGGNREQAA